MPSGTAFRIGLYYKNAPDTPVSVSSTNILYDPAAFPDRNHFIYFQLNVPTLSPGDACVGKKMGIELISPLDFILQGGYWDVDDVRLTSTTFQLINPVCTNGEFRVGLQSGPGERVEVLTADNPALPVSEWTSLGTVTNITGSDSFTNSVVGQGRRFFQARIVR
jgi:hypothetical protein